MVMKASVLLLVAFTTSSAAQARPLRLADSSADVILPRINEIGGLSVVARILRQEIGVQPMEKLDALADLMAERVIAAKSGPEHTDAYLKAIGTMSVLAAAGALRGGGGVQYPGVFDRMIRIHQQAGPTPLRSLGLRWLTAVGPPDRALQYLRTVAVSSDRTASHAIQALITEATHGGLSLNPPPLPEQARALVRDLWDKRAVTEPIALSLLNHFAGTQEWFR